MSTDKRTKADLVTEIHTLRKSLTKVRAEEQELAKEVNALREYRFKWDDLVKRKKTVDSLIEANATCVERIRTVLTENESLQGKANQHDFYQKECVSLERANEELERKNGDQGAQNADLNKYASQLEIQLYNLKKAIKHLTKAI